MPDHSPPNGVEAASGKFFYGWVIVATCALMIGITFGLMYSYSVFFKPLADYFNWNRATVSLIYSASMIIRGTTAIGIGLLADRYGPRKLMVFCGLMIGLGLVLSSQVHNMWQLFLTYSVVEAIGLSGAWGVGTALISRWFTKNRGLAMGMASTGSGLGILFIVPGAERLIDSFGWSQAFFICGVAAGFIVVALAMLLRQSPHLSLPGANELVSQDKVDNGAQARQDDASLGQAIRDSRLILLMGVFLLFFFSVQIVIVHLVNYATDIGINPLTAATFVSIIGIISIGGRLSTGVGADRIGVHNTLILTQALLVIAFICLIFTRSLWMFYLFAVIFSLPYGGEIPQIPLYIGRYFGTKKMATLVGLSSFVTSIGGALGPLIAGKIYDTTESYQWAFIAGALANVAALALVVKLKRINRAAERTSPGMT